MYELGETDASFRCECSDNDDVRVTPRYSRVPLAKLHTFDILLHAQAMMYSMVKLDFSHGLSAWAEH